jgi:hypothetical protein
MRVAGRTNYLESRACGWPPALGRRVDGVGVGDASTATPSMRRCRDRVEGSDTVENSLVEALALGHRDGLVRRSLAFLGRFLLCGILGGFFQRDALGLLRLQTMELE